MSTEEPQRDASAPAEDAQMQESATNAAAAAPAKRRPKLDLSALGLGGGERKRGKSMFGVLVNTLNKAKAEDKERNASEAAKKRQLIEQRLQNKLKKETDSVRKAEEAKKDKVTALRREEELQLKDSIQKLRRTRTNLLSNFLLTSDVIPDADSELTPEQLQPAVPKRSHPPPLYYLPAILTPAQEAFLTKRKELAKEAAEKEWEAFKDERAKETIEIQTLRRKVAEITESQKTESANGLNTNENKERESESNADTMEDEPERRTEGAPDSAEGMDIDDGKEEQGDEGRKGDDDDAVEY